MADSPTGGRNEGERVLSHEEMAADRSGRLEAILTSPSNHRLIVAGPGTGKTYTFQQLIEPLDGKPLVLSFLSLLVDDLASELGESAYVYTFHGFARWSLHTQGADGVSNDVDYYPPLVDLQAQDVQIRHGDPIEASDLGAAFRELSDDARLHLALESGAYYDSVGHDDSVYRVLMRFREAPDVVPRYPLLLVDEFQDFSPLEVAFIEALAVGTPSIIVGDDDQALYAFRNASSEAIRALHSGPDYENFNLPYCSRCTEVLVEATHTVVARAQVKGLLAGRITKPYICYSPDKGDESAAYPEILHASCSVQRQNANYMGRYIAGRIRDIASEDVQVSRAGRYPTVLVIGPKPFLPQIAEFLEAEFDDVVAPSSAVNGPQPEDAYRRLLNNRDSRLGWRILVHLRQPAGWEETMRQALEGEVELATALPDEFKVRELRRVDLYARACAGAQLDDEEWVELEAAFGEDRTTLATRLAPAPDIDPGTVPDDVPSIRLTSLMGSKGLQAEHVFVAGINGGHFPRANEDPTNVEVCQLLVALTRARKSCTLVSTRRLGQQQLDRSTFAEWLAPHVSDLYVDKQYLDARQW